MAGSLNPRGPIYDRSAPGGTAQQRMAYASLVLLGVTVLIAVLVLANGWRHAQATLYTLAALWAIGAPLWFFIEYYCFYRKAAAPDSWELFKHGQQVAISIWAGVTAVLYALGGSDLAKPPKNERECTIVLSAPASTNPGAQQTFILKCDPEVRVPTMPSK